MSCAVSKNAFGAPTLHLLEGLSSLVFRRIAFIWNFSDIPKLARSGKFRAAREKLATIEPPKGYLALKETYDAWLASMCHAANVTFEPSESHRAETMLELIAEYQTHRWFLAPSSERERYCAAYLEYLKAVILSDGDQRRHVAQQLKKSPAHRFFKDVLPVS
jgi:hypothetical protein